MRRRLPLHGNIFNSQASSTKLNLGNVLSLHLLLNAAPSRLSFIWCAFALSTFKEGSHLLMNPAKQL